jgi:hypothetical protein
MAHSILVLIRHPNCRDNWTYRLKRRGGMHAYWAPGSHTRCPTTASVDDWPLNGRERRE